MKIPSGVFEPGDERGTKPQVEEGAAVSDRLGHYPAPAAGEANLEGVYVHTCGPWGYPWRINREPDAPRCLAHLFARCEVCHRGQILVACVPGMKMLGMTLDGVRWAEEPRP